MKKAMHFPNTTAPMSRLPTLEGAGVGGLAGTGHVTLGWDPPPTGFRRCHVDRVVRVVGVVVDDDDI